MPDRGPFHFAELHPPRMTPDTARQAIQALASLSGHPRVVLEARGGDGEVHWFIGAEAAVVRRAVAAMKPFLNELRVTPPPGERESSDVAAAVRMRGHRRAPLDASRTEAAARGLLGALAGAGRGEQVRLQVVLGPRHRPRLAGDLQQRRAEERAPLKAKLGEHRFSCEVRISSTAADIARSRRLVENVAAAMRTLEVPGVALHLRKATTRSADDATNPFIWPLELSISDIAAITSWPIANKDIELPGVAPIHPRDLPVWDRMPSEGRVLGVSTLDASRGVAQGIEEAKRATHVMGPMGSGKSTLACSLCLTDIDAGGAAIFIDAKGDSLVDLMQRIRPERVDDVVVLDPSDIAPVGIDVFAGDPERSADVVFRVFKDLYGGDLGPRSSNLLHASLVTLARAGGYSMSHLPMLLGNARFRRKVVAKVGPDDPMGLGAHWAWFEALSDGEKLQVTSPLRNKLDPVVSLRRGMRAAFGQTSPKFSFADIFAPGTKRPIVLINLGTSELGPEGARVWGSICLALIWEAAQARARVPESQRHVVSIYVDEFQEVARLGDLADALGRARGLSVAFTLMHQAFSQLSPATKDAVLNLPRSRVCFQLNSKDAKEIAATTNGVLTTEDLHDLAAFTAYASLQVGGDRAPWCSIKTAPLPPALREATVVRERSRELYGRPIAEVEAHLLEAAGFADEPDVPETFGRSTRHGGSS